MPELPEVETVRRGLANVWLGQRFRRVTCHRAGLRQPFPEGFAQIATGRIVEAMDRRAKYLLVRLSGGVTMIIHLGMSGRMVIAPDDSGPVGRHDHVVFVTEAGIRVTFCDPRRFGVMTLCDTAQWTAHPLLADIGPEPLDEAVVTPKWMKATLAGRSAPIKAVLLDQTTIAGLGNIYVSEALFRAGIHPACAANEVPASRMAPLVKAIRDVLTEAIASGGSTLRDHVRPDGE